MKKVRTTTPFPKKGIQISLVSCSLGVNFGEKMAILLVWTFHFSTLKRWNYKMTFILNWLAPESGKPMCKTRQYNKDKWGLSPVRCTRLNSWGARTVYLRGRVFRVMSTGDDVALCTVMARPLCLGFSRKRICFSWKYMKLSGPLHWNTDNRPHCRKSITGLNSLW